MLRPTQVAVANRVFLKANSSSMTICAGRDTTLAAKQVMTFFWRTPPFRVKFIFFLWITINLCGIGGVLKKKRSSPLSVSALYLVSYSKTLRSGLLFWSVPSFNHQNMVSLVISQSHFFLKNQYESVLPPSITS